MDVKEYISSGILELYTMSSLSAEEMNGVERMAAEHSEVAVELNAVQNALNNYSTVHGRNPRPSLRAEVMQKIEGSKGESRGRVRKMRGNHDLTYKYLIAACIASLIISTFGSVFFYQKWSEAEDHYLTIMNEKNQMAQNLNLVKYEYEKMNGDISLMHDPAMEIVSLRAVDSSKYFRARVYWNKYTHETYVDVQDLPSPATDKQYQLWALVGGQPVDAGIFNMGDDMGMQKVKLVLNADAWAVTLEPKGGSAAPTMDQMYLISKI